MYDVVIIGSPVEHLLVREVCILASQERVYGAGRTGS